MKKQDFSEEAVQQVVCDCLEIGMTMEQVKAYMKTEAFENSFKRYVAMMEEEFQPNLKLGATK